ncbi:hypothetical protein [Poritiphilus flavus]|uniref:Uncharacterized protein n=1 Tax=Poritiphilus flavus TaxID=2697053 RepID=A0A6L9EH64_9FLAO|nr:hypothetical protein [Poritiphilus flavus]NAS14137.1 hypothetical protein [Poritiphilus flavus]
MIKNRLDIVFVISVVIMAVISCVIITRTFEKRTVQERNEEVLAEILEAPNSCDNLGRRPPYSKIRYNNRVYIKKTSNRFCHLVSNRDNVKMLINEEGNELLFPNEYDPAQFLYGGALLLIAVIIFVRKFWL